LWFAGTFVVVLGLIDAAFYGYLVRAATATLRRELGTDTHNLARALGREEGEHGDADGRHGEPRREDGDGDGIEVAQNTVTAANVREELAEWPGGPTRFVVLAADGHVVGHVGPADEVAALARLDAPPMEVVDVVTVSEFGRYVRTRVGVDESVGWSVVGARSLAGLDAYRAVLRRWILLSVPGVTLLSMVVGYLLAGRSLAAVTRMSEAIDAIEPSDLDRRLPVRTPPDELDHLAHRFNALLERLTEAGRRNRAFLARAAHQIRTPLTLVLAESELGLDQPATARDSETVQALRRVNAAGRQMTHRVNELFLLARAEAGDSPALEDDVEIDGLALECTDLMRRRATTLRRRLELQRIEPHRVRGHEALLREALLELIENALKHGHPESPVLVSAYVERGRAWVMVSNRGRPVPEPVAPRRTGDLTQGGHLGLAILQWIAAVHDGDLRITHDHSDNRIAIVWPCVPSLHTPPPAA